MNANPFIIVTSVQELKPNCIERETHSSPKCVAYNRHIVGCERAALPAGTVLVLSTLWAETKASFVAQRLRMRRSQNEPKLEGERKMKQE